MTNTEKIAKDVCDRHGLPSSLYHHIDELPYVPADEIERRFAYRGKPYIDVDGEWRTGKEYIHADLLNPRRNESETPEPVSKAVLVGFRNGAIIGVGLWGLLWLFWEYAWPFIWAWTVRP